MTRMGSVRSKYGERRSAIEGAKVFSQPADAARSLSIRLSGCKKLGSARTVRRASKFINQLPQEEAGRRPRAGTGNTASLLPGLLR